MKLLDKICLWGMAIAALLFFIPYSQDSYLMPRYAAAALCSLPLFLVKRERESNLELAALLFISVATICAWFGVDRVYSVIGCYGFSFDSLLALATYSVVMLAASRCSESIEEAAKVIVYVSIPVSVYGLIQRYILNSDPLIPHGAHFFGTRIISTQGGPVYLGACLSLIIIMSAYLARKKQKLGWIGLLLAIPALWFTQTRGALLAAVVGGSIVYSSLPFFVFLPGLLLGSRFIASQSDAGRIEVWRIAWKAFKEHPLLGYGPGNFFLAFRQHIDGTFIHIMHNTGAAQAHAHNEILGILATMGIAGFIAYTILVCCIFLLALIQTDKDDKRLLLGLIAGYFFISQFNPVPNSVIMMMAIIFGIASSCRTQGHRRFFPALAAIGIVFLSGRLTIADWQYAKGLDWKDINDVKMAERMSKAQMFNPWEIKIISGRLDSADKLLPLLLPKGAENLALVNLRLARHAIRIHPTDAFAHDAYGKQILVAFLCGVKADPKEAMQEFNTAQGFAPTFERLVWRRLGVARVIAAAFGNMAPLVKANEDLKRLHGYEAYN